MRASCCYCQLCPCNVLHFFYCSTRVPSSKNPSQSVKGPFAGEIAEALLWISMGGRNLVNCPALLFLMRSSSPFSKAGFITDHAMTEEKEGESLMAFFLLFLEDVPLYVSYCTFAAHVRVCVGCLYIRYSRVVSLRLPICSVCQRFLKDLSPFPSSTLLYFTVLTSTVLVRTLRTSIKRRQNFKRRENPKQLNLPLS